MKSTIRGKIIILFIVCLGFIGIVTLAYTWSIYVLKGRITNMEAYEDILNNILELRRFEKNFLFTKDPNSLKEITFYLDELPLEIERVSENIISVMGRQPFEIFAKTLADYRKIMEAPDRPGPGQVSEIRAKGKVLVDFAQSVIEAKRIRINSSLKQMLYVPMAFLWGFVTLILLTYQLITRTVLGRLSLVLEATRGVAQGQFHSIADPAKRKDEVSELIDSFNQMQAELDARQEQLVHSRKMASIGTFTSGIAHELNNPLNNISLTADCLLSEYPPMSPDEIKEMIADIISQTERASDVVKNLLDFSRQEHPVRTHLQIADVVQASERLIRNQLKLGKVTFTQEIASGLPSIEGNRDNLKQVFINLFLNAIQAMPGGGILRVKAWQESESMLRIDIQDTGTGIPAEAIDQIFDPFYTTKAVGQGTGLGLSIVYGVVTKHGGRLEVHSLPGQGTVFSIFLPVSEIKETA
jgi:two-component system NtrC family sensor kinase